MKAKPLSELSKAMKDARARGVDYKTLQMEEAEREDMRRKSRRELLPMERKILKPETPGMTTAMFAEFLRGKGMNAVVDNGCVIVMVKEITGRTTAPLKKLVAQTGFKGSYGWRVARPQEDKDV